MADSQLSECAKAFINLLTARARQQFAALLNSFKTFIRTKIALLKAQIARLDVLSAAIRIVLANVNGLLIPIEAQYNQLFSTYKELKDCVPLYGFAKDVQDSYFTYKNLVYTESYKLAQQVSLQEALKSNLRKLEDSVKFIDKIINYMNDLTTFKLETGDAVTVYTTRKGDNGKEYPITYTGVILGTEVVGTEIKESGKEVPIYKTRVKIDKTNEEILVDPLELDARS